MQLGEINHLYIIRSREQGLYLGQEGQTEGGVLLPNAYVTSNMQIGDQIDVFLYHDGEQRITATTIIPPITLHSFAPLKVKATTSFGCFLEWGLPKDNLLPNNETQAPLPKVGDTVVVFLFIDQETSRLVATAKVENILENKDVTFVENDVVNVLLYRETPLGFMTIINNQHIGLLYKNEVYQKPLKIGDTVQAFIKSVRNDNKIDLVLQKQGFDHVVDSKSIIFDLLQKSGGKMAYTDKSSPEDIYSKFNMSKKVWKKAVGGLMKEGKVIQDDTGISIVNV